MWSLVTTYFKGGSPFSPTFCFYFQLHCDKSIATSGETRLEICRQRQMDAKVGLYIRYFVKWNRWRKGSVTCACARRHRATARARQINSNSWSIVDVLTCLNRWLFNSVQAFLYYKLQISEFTVRTCIIN